MGFRSDLEAGSFFGLEFSSLDEEAIVLPSYPAVMEEGQKACGPAFRQARLRGIDWEGVQGGFGDSDP